MNDRIQKALDGEISPDALHSREQEEFVRTQAAFERLLREMPEADMPDLAPAVLARIERLRPVPPFVSRLRWPRLAYVFVVLAVLATTLGINTFLLLNQESIPPRNEGVKNLAAQVQVRFRLLDSSAREVALAGEFTGWKPHYRLKESPAGVWTAVVPLKPGLHNYVFIVDGDRWIPDPQAPRVEDGFGGFNSRVAVLAPDSKGKL